MMNIFAELKVNPFADDVVSEPRRVSYSVEGLNATPLQRLIDEFHELTVGDLPRKPAVGRKARLVVSPDRGYGKSHLLGRLFQALGDQATLIYLRPFQDPQRVWISILLATVQELERPNQDGTATQLEAFSKGVLAHVAADQLARVPLGNVSQVQDAVKSLRAHPLKVLGQTSTVLIRWLKSRFDDRAELGKLGALLKEREMNLAQRETAWLKVLAGYAFTLPHSLEREAALKWLRADPLEDDEVAALKLAAADNEGRADSSVQEINELSFRRLQGLCALAAYYRPFLFCFDQTEFYGGNKALVDALGRCISDFHSSLANNLTIVTTNANNWSQEILPDLQRAYQNRFSDDKIMLEGITPDQSKQLIELRLRATGAPDAAFAEFIRDGWLESQFRFMPEIGVRDLLMKAAARFRSLVFPGAHSGEPPPPTPLADLYAIEINKIHANTALHQYNQDCLMWFAEVLAGGHEGVTIKTTANRYFAIRWAWPNRSTYFAFEGGDNNARWRAIAKEAIELSKSGKTVATFVFRTPDLKSIPRPTWGPAKAQVETAQKHGFRIVALSLDEVCELHAARELYSNALQRNIDCAPAEVLAWLKARFEPWLKRYAAIHPPALEQPAPPPSTTKKPRARQVVAPIETMLSKTQLDTVERCVGEKMLVDIREVLRELGDESLQPALLRAVETNPRLKAHPGPQTIYLQWRIVA